MSNGVIRVQYAAKPETRVYSEPEDGRTINRILLGTWAGVIADEGGNRVKVVTAGPDGWVDRDDLRDTMGLKIFFVDVGQGDGVLVEAPGKRILVDGGPNTNLRRYLRGWQYSYLLNNDQKVHIDTVFVSHFDADHYRGLTAIIEDEDFTFGTLYHNGIARFHSNRSQRPEGYNQDLGEVEAGVLKTTFNDMNDVHELLAAGGLQKTFHDFLEAVVQADAQGRLERVLRLTSRDGFVPHYAESQDLSIEVLGPVPRNPSGRYDWPWFSSSSHTRNGHSIVLRLTYSENGHSGRSFLLGGDLNSEAEHHLMSHYSGRNPFQVDVAKSCHHGSSDFTVDFMAQVNPYATVISSGDNESYAHPRADAVGCAGRYSRGERPLVFSTELARSISSGGDILYGMINCRCDGNQIIMAQMKESGSASDIWDSYVV